jgi:very-short-patch-repair endonuclease
MLKHFQKKLRAKSTCPEKILWEFLRDRRLYGYKFRRQQILREFIVDFVCYEYKLIIELDGMHHDEQKEKDAARTRVLEQDGFTVIRFWNHDVHGDVSIVLGAIFGALRKISGMQIHPSSGAARHLLPQGEKVRVP